MEKSVIALIEDEAILQQMVQMEFEQAGYKVVVASDGEAGLALVKAEKPKILLLDLMLPKLNGFQVLEALAKDSETKNIPVFILSNLGQDQEKQRAMDLGARAFYIKANINLEELVIDVKKLLSAVV